MTVSQVRNEVMEGSEDSSGVHTNRCPHLRKTVLNKVVPTAAGTKGHALSLRSKEPASF